MLIIYRSNIYRCSIVPLSGRFVGHFGTTLDMHSFGRSGSIWIFPLLDVRVESELPLRLHGKLKPSNLILIGYFISAS